MVSDIPGLIGEGSTPVALGSVAEEARFKHAMRQARPEPGPGRKGVLMSCDVVGRKVEMAL